MKRITTTNEAKAIERFCYMPDEAGVRLPTAKAMLGCSGATVWRLAREGKLSAIKISPRVTAFRVGSIRALLAGGAV